MNGNYSGISGNNIVVGATIYGNNIMTTPARSEQSDDDKEVIQELEELYRQLADREPMIAEAITDLRKAIEKQDRPAIGKKILSLTTGYAASIIGSALTAKLKKYLPS